MKLNRILAVVELETNSATLEAALSLTQKYQAELTAMTVIYDPLIEAERHVYPLGNDDLIQRDRAQLQLDRLVSRVTTEQGVQLPVKTMVVRGKTEQVILKEAKEQKIDLLILGHRPEWRIEHLLFGRTLDHLVAKSACAVLVVPEP